MNIQELYKKYNNDIQFLSIYIREAHPKDGWWLGNRFTKKLIEKIITENASMEHNDPKTIEERRAVAGDCETAHQDKGSFVEPGRCGFSGRLTRYFEKKIEFV